LNDAILYDSVSGQINNTGNAAHMRALMCKKSREFAKNHVGACTDRARYSIENSANSSFPQSRSFAQKRTEKYGTGDQG